MEAVTEKLIELVSLSNRYGANPEYTLYRGGNSSYKTENTLYVKASGMEMAKITQEGFCALDRAGLKAILDNEPEGTDRQVEETVEKALLAARLPGEEKTPSVETMLHEVFPQRFVLHLHPTLLNGMTCARQGEVTAKILYGQEVLWIPESKPGYALAAEAAGEMRKFRENAGHDCAVVFLQNHGVFVAADETAVIERLLTLITQAARRFTPSAPAFEDICRLPENLQGLLGDGALMDASAPAQESISHPDFSRLATLTPDHMTTCGAFLLKTTAESLPDDIKACTEREGEAPKLIGIPGIGVIALGENVEKSREILALFRDALKIVSYAEGSGGVRFMSSFLVKTLQKRMKTDR